MSLIYYESLKKIYSVEKSYDHLYIKMTALVKTTVISTLHQSEIYQLQLTEIQLLRK